MKYLIFYPVLLLTLLSCSHQSNEEVTANLVPISGVIHHTTFSDNVSIGPKWIEFPGAALGFVWSEERDLPPDKRSHTTEIHLHKGQSFDPYLLLQSPEETVVLITAIVNFEQVPFELDGRLGLLHEVTISPEGDLEIPMQIDINKPGQHDVMVLAFVDPYSKRFDLDYRSSMDPRMIGRRAAIIVDKNETPGTMLPTPVIGQSVPNNASTFSPRIAFGRYDPFEQSHPANINHQLYVEKHSANTPFKFKIWLSNFRGDTPVEYAFILFHNFQQTNIDGKPFMVVNLDQKEELILESEVQLSPMLGMNQLQLISVLSPYQPIGINNSLVFGSPRIAILAEE